MSTAGIAAKVIWTPEAEGGRKELPGVPIYSTVARFPGEDWSKGAWSVVLEFNTPPNQQGSPSIGWARFLSSDAPQGRLKAGAKFQLFEGAKHVASVELIADDEGAPIRMRPAP
jgi:hypothetical protein